MDKFLKTAELKDLEKKVAKGEISYSKMVEEINLKAYIYYNSMRDEMFNSERYLRLKKECFKQMP
jgi:hypothetical protein